MKKIVKEIIENNPELENSKVNLEKAADILEKNNPKILPTNEFKKSLKSRLQGIIGLKQGKKSNLIIFAMPVFSLLFVIGGFVYYYDDIKILNDGTRIYNADKLTEEEILNIELEQLGELFENIIPIENSIEIKPEGINNKNILQNRVEDSINKTIKTIEKNEDLSEDEMSEYINDIFEIESIDNIEMRIDKVDDNSILEIFESLDVDLSEEAENMIFEEGLYEERENDFIMEPNFEIFCNNEKGKLTGTGGIQKCITDKKECFASEFKNGICEFKEIK